MRMEPQMNADERGWIWPRRRRGAEMMDQIGSFSASLRLCGGFHVVVVLLGLLQPLPAAEAVELQWTSPNRYRVLLTVDPRGKVRSNSPAAAQVDFKHALTEQGGGGTFDEHTIEVIAYDGTGAPQVFDATREGQEQYLLPWRLDKLHGIDAVTLSFVMPNHTLTRYAAYFDTAESGLGKPQRYPGLVGDGDWFREVYARREIAASMMDTFCDFDDDGDLDMMEGGVEPYVYYYENVGQNRFVERGRLTSDGSVFALPANSGNRSWMVVRFHDWDGDGDQDFFPSFTDGPDVGHIVVYENTTPAGGQLRFTRRGRLLTLSGQQLGGGWFPSIVFVDWDRDGLKDLLVARGNRLAFYRNLGPDGVVSNIRLADPIDVQAGGQPFDLFAPGFDAADIDGDGDLDLFAGTVGGPILYYQNVAAQPTDFPVMAAAVTLVEDDFGPVFIFDAYTGIEVADWTGDGVLDFVGGRFWERTRFAANPHFYGTMYENTGSLSSAQFERRGAQTGAPYTEQFQICDAVRQNGVRAVDWNNDGRTDLLGGDTDGYVWLFVNQTGNKFPVFAVGEKLLAGGQILSVQASGGHARFDVTDWNNDGRKDLMVADGGGWLTRFMNQGTDAGPVLAAGVRVQSAGVDIDRGGRSSCMVVDWNHDGAKDVVMADQDGGYFFYRNTGSDANPALAAADPVRFGNPPENVSYVRPNLGSYVDWDGDGVKDFIGCGFENDIRFYKNLASASPGVKPVFADPDGQVIVQPTSIMLVSGADAVDWNGDGDRDILTGQGHGGSGLRYYERDYINDQLAATPPLVTVEIPPPPIAIGDLDGDDDTDLGDFGLLQVCMRGSGMPYPPGCAGADLDGDFDVDPVDGELLRACMGGADLPPGCTPRAGAR